MATQYSVFIKVSTTGAEKAASDLEKLKKAADSAGKASSGLASSNSLLSRSFGILKEAMPILAAYETAKGFLELDNVTANLIQRLNAAGVESGSMNDAIIKMGGAATRAHVSLESLSELFSKINLGIQDLGYSYEKQLDISQAVAESFTISGANAQTERSSILELSHAYDLGYMSLKQYTALKQEDPALMKLLISNWKTATKSQIDFNQAVREGKVDSESLTKTIMASKKTLDDQANSYVGVNKAITDFTTKVETAIATSKTWQEANKGTASVIERTGDALSKGIEYLDGYTSKMMAADNVILTLTEGTLNKGKEYLSSFASGLVSAGEAAEKSSESILSFIKLMNPFASSSDYAKNLKDAIDSLTPTYKSVVDTIGKKPIGVKMKVSEESVKKIPAELQKELSNISKMGGKFTIPIDIKESFNKEDLGKYLNIHEFGGYYKSAISDIDKLTDAYGGLTPEVAAARDKIQELATSVTDSQSVTKGQVDAMQQYFEKLDNEVNKPLITFKNYKSFVEKETPSLNEMLQSGTRDLASGFADALISVQTHSKTAKEAFKDMASSIVQDLERMAVKALMFKAIEAGIDWLSGGSGGMDAGGLSTGFGDLTSTPKSVMSGMQSKAPVIVNTTLNSTANYASAFDKSAHATNLEAQRKMIENTVKGVLLDEKRVGGMNYYG